MTLILAQRLVSAMNSGDSIRQPDSVILLSPWLDVSGSNPQWETFASVDPFLDVFGLKVFGELLASGPDAVATTDPKVSPLFGSLEGLPPVSVWTSTHDLLSPDSRSLRDRYANEGITTTFRFVDEKFLSHCWWMWGMSHGAKTIKEIVAAIKEDCNL